MSVTMVKVKIPGLDSEELYMHNVRTTCCIHMYMYIHVHMYM